MQSRCCGLNGLEMASKRRKGIIFKIGEKKVWKKITPPTWSCISLRGSVRLSTRQSIRPSKKNLKSLGLCTQLPNVSHLLITMETRKATNPFLDLQLLEQLRGARCPTKGEVFRFLFFSSLYPKSLRWCSEGSCWRCAIILDGPLWSKIEENTDKIAIQSFTVLRAREWAKWASERTSERSGGRERSKQSGANKGLSGASERTSEWPSTTVCNLSCYQPWCGRNYAKKRQICQGRPQ